MYKYTDYKKSWLKQRTRKKVYVEEIPDTSPDIDSPTEGEKKIDINSYQSWDPRELLGEVFD